MENQNRFSAVMQAAEEVLSRARILEAAANRSHVGTKRSLENFRATNAPFALQPLIIDSTLVARVTQELAATRAVRVHDILQENDGPMTPTQRSPRLPPSPPPPPPPPSPSPPPSLLFTALYCRQERCKTTIRIRTMRHFAHL